MRMTNPSPRLSDILGRQGATLGAIGVGLAAYSTHAGGGELGRTASQFLILHAAALLGLAGAARGAALRRVAWLLFAGSTLALGTLLFSGDLAMRAFRDVSLFPFAAPIGGSLMILAWVALALVFAVPEQRAE